MCIGSDICEIHFGGVINTNETDLRTIHGKKKVNLISVHL